MDEAIGEFISNLGVKLLEKYQESQISNLFRYAIEKKPELENSIKNVKNSQDIENLFEEITGIIDADAGDGSIEINQAIITAMKCASFNHSNGTIVIDGSTISAFVLVTGGVSGSKGTTTIRGTNLKSKGTEIRIGKNASIKMSGGANIRQN